MNEQDLFLIPLARPATCDAIQYVLVLMVVDADVGASVTPVLQNHGSNGSSEAEICVATSPGFNGRMYFYQSSELSFLLGPLCLCG